VRSHGHHEVPKRPLLKRRNFMFRLLELLSPMYANSDPDPTAVSKWIVGSLLGGSCPQSLMFQFQLPVDLLPRDRPPEELKGWKGWGNYIQSTNRYCPGGRCYVIDKAIMDDYPKLVEELKQKNPTWRLSGALFNEDVTGQHSDTAPKEFVVYHLMYDKFNARKAVIKGRKQYQWHI
jgi:hypothetical protein